MPYFVPILGPGARFLSDFRSAVVHVKSGVNPEPKRFGKEVEFEPLWRSFSELWPSKVGFKNNMEMRTPFLTLLDSPWKARGSYPRWLCSGFDVATFTQSQEIK